MEALTTKPLQKQSACIFHCLSQQAFLLYEFILVEYLTPSSRYGVLIIVEVGLRSVFRICDEVLLLWGESVNG